MLNNVKSIGLNLDVFSLTDYPTLRKTRIVVGKKAKIRAIFSCKLSLMVLSISGNQEATTTPGFQRPCPTGTVTRTTTILLSEKNNAVKTTKLSYSQPKIFHCKNGIFGRNSKIFSLSNKVFTVLHGKKGFVTATKLRTTNTFLLLQPKILLQQPNVL